MALEVKTLTINELRKMDENEPLWVLNGTMKNPKDRSNIVIMLPLKDGEAQPPLAIFATWVPICVTDKIERKDLLRSRQFLEALDRRKIVAIPNEEAQRILREPGALQEQERVRMMDINSATGDALGSMEEDNSIKVEVPGMDEGDSDPIGNTVHQYVGLLADNSGIEALNSLRNLGDLSLEEFQFILKEARGYGESHKEVIQFCKAKITALRDGGVPSGAIGGKAQRIN